MKRKLTSLLLILFFVLCLSACQKDNSSFKVTFINVGEGDAALVECEGEFMLIDAGRNDKESKRKVSDTLAENGVNKLKYLVISHWHEDHYGGLKESVTGANALKGIRKVDKLLSNQYTDTKAKDTPPDIKDIIDSIKREKNAKAEIPDKNDTYKLGSALITVVEVLSNDNNDSLVLLISYDKTSFLFTGDIEGKAQKKVVEALQASKISNRLKASENLIKMPHHGAHNSNGNDNHLKNLLHASNAEYFVISSGKGENAKNHPHDETLKTINQVSKKTLFQTNKIFRTDDEKLKNNENLVFVSDGKNITNIKHKK